MKKFKLNDNITWKELCDQYGFEEDPTNDPGNDRYGSYDNYYIQLNKEFRISILINTREIEILNFSKTNELTMLTDLSVLYEMIQNNAVECITD